MTKQQCGLIGLGVMGSNLAQNLQTSGAEMFVHSYDKTEQATFHDQHPEITCCDSIADLGLHLSKPRVVLLMVTAGEAVDNVIDDLVPHLSPDDIIIDGGNSHYPDTLRRQATLKKAGIHLLGTGISGGEEGARHGASVMAGGDKAAFKVAQPLLEAIAFDLDGEVCCGWMGEGGAGHFVKMVHNGIEYGMMQLIAEVWDFMSRGLGMTPQEAKLLFESWQTGPLESYLVEITCRIMAQPDNQSNGPLLLKIDDQAGQKGTGRWTVDAAMTLGCPVPSITAAVIERQISSLKETRVAAAQLRPSPIKSIPGDTDWAPLLEQALFGAILVTYAQGLALIHAASKQYQWHTDLAAVVSLWRGGCIIRADLLNELRRMFLSDPGISNLLRDKSFTNLLADSSPEWRKANSAAIAAGIPIPALSASIAYMDSMQSSQMPTNLIQAQRDYFGAHGYRRIDRPGSFHTRWNDQQS